MATARIAAAWVETEERRIGHQIPRGMRSQLTALRHDAEALREELAARHRE